MVGRLLLRGMLAGIVAAFLSFGFLDVYGEPAVERAIAFEAKLGQTKAKAKSEEAVAKGMPTSAPEPGDGMVSQPTQAGIGLFTGVGAYNVASAGLFALVFALVFSSPSFPGAWPRLARVPRRPSPPRSASSPSTSSPA